jgi:membrane-associated phospholipid phosphatase
VPSARDAPSPDRRPSTLSEGGRPAWDDPASGATRPQGWFRAKFRAEVRPRTEEQRRHLFVIAAVLVVVGLAGFCLLLYDVLNHDGLAALDRPLQRAVEHYRSGQLTAVMIVLAAAFGPVAMPIIVLITTVWWFLKSDHAWRPLMLAAAMITGVILAEVIAHLVGRPRPPVSQMLFGVDHTFSFPSGHVLGIANFLLTGSYLWFSRSRNLAREITGIVVAAVLLAVMCADRIYLGYHWPTDTLASVCLALLELGVVIAVDAWRTVSTPTRSAPATARGEETTPAAAGG